ncbi:OsmC family protein [Mycolicibacterium thermoresistibile]
MATESFVGNRQDPLRARYRSEPGAAHVTDRARATFGAELDPFHGRVVPGTRGGESVVGVGAHAAVGGFHDQPNPGDLLCAALAACLDSTMRMIADRMGIRLTELEVDVTGDVDVRGALMVSPDVPVGFTQMRCTVQLAAADGTPAHVLQGLTTAAEQCCIVLNTLRNGVSVDTAVNAV